MAETKIPAATYRVQLDKNFRFDDASLLAPYLHDLGISDIYLSPITRARAGSSHGYDVEDPTSLNPELGSPEDFGRMSGEFRKLGMGIVLDVVPNHLAAGSGNPWWMDVLENGRFSPYAGFFDIDWEQSDVRRGKVILPVLGSPLPEVINEGEIILALEDTGLFLNYHEKRLPLSLESYAMVISRVLAAPDAMSVHETAASELRSLLADIGSLTEQESSAESYTRREAIKGRFGELLSSNEVRASILASLGKFNERGSHEAFNLMSRLLDSQTYELAFWRTGLKQINYRRFFDIADLVGIKVEDPEVFDAVHSLVFDLVDEGRITGLRIDHIDGLFDPLQYLHRLQDLLEPETGSLFYVVVEKILTGDEVLPGLWPVMGTTGYDFANYLNNVFVDPAGFQLLKKAYEDFTGTSDSFAEVLYQKKRQALDELFQSEVDRLASRLSTLAQLHAPDRNLRIEELRDALIEMIACLPVYRTYIRDEKISQTDRHYIEEAFNESRRKAPGLSNGLSFLKEVLLLGPVGACEDAKLAYLRFTMSWQQFTGATMAKGHEDTALYSYNPLVSLNEVGGKPVISHCPLDHFHDQNLQRSRYRPFALNATSTHDTKRGEDVRARVNVLSEIPEEWRNMVGKWTNLNSSSKRKVDGETVPEPSLELLIYQTLVGAWPFHESGVPEFRERMKSYLTKAMREAKKITSWLSINRAYEYAVLSFFQDILDIPAFMDAFRDFQRRVAFYGGLNSLSQVILKIASPGVPDFYRGTETWDLSLVDPDNRRPVNFDSHRRMLADAKPREKPPHLSGRGLSLFADGCIKLYTTHKALRARAENPELFLQASYTPLEARGSLRNHIVSFARNNGERWLIAAVPRFFTRLVPEGTMPLGGIWGDGRLVLPGNSPRKWQNVFTGELTSDGGELRVCELFESFPVALLLGTR